MYQLLKQLGRPLMLVAIGGASCLVVLVTHRRQRKPEDSPEEMARLFLLNEQLEDPASPEAMEAIEASWRVAGHAADRVKASALCIRAPSDFWQCSLRQLLEFFNQAGVTVVSPVDDHLDLNFTRPQLVVRARACLNRWEFQRFKMCMISLTDPTICSRAMLRIRQLMPPPSSRNALRCSATYLQQKLLIDADDYVWDLPYVDRLFVNSGELEAELEAAVGVMSWEVDRQEWWIARRNPRAVAQESGRIGDVLGLLKLDLGPTEA